MQEQQNVVDEQSLTPEESKGSDIKQFEDAIIVRSVEDVMRHYNSQDIFQGQKTLEQIQEDIGSLDISEDINANKISLGADLFTDIGQVDKYNLEDFEYFVRILIIQYLENGQEKKALEFPASLNFTARFVIHKICDFLGLASASVGKG